MVIIKQIKRVSPMKIFSAYAANGFQNHPNHGFIGESRPPVSETSMNMLRAAKSLQLASNRWILSWKMLELDMELDMV